MSDTTDIGELNLDSSSRVIVSTWIWKGRRYGGFRKHVATKRYSGATPAKMVLRHTDAKSLVKVLTDIQAPGRKLSPGTLEIIKVSDTKSIHVQLVPSDVSGKLPKVDIREHKSEGSFTGFTKSGIRLGWDKLGPFAALIGRLADALAEKEGGDSARTPNPVSQSVKADAGSPESQKENFTPKQFPEDFLPPGELKATMLELEDLPLEVTTDRDGKWVVQDQAGYRKPVRNPSEGKFILYSHMRGKRSILLPAETFVAFKAVAAYQVYCRDLRTEWTQAHMRNFADRELALFRAKQRLQQLGMPADT